MPAPSIALYLRQCLAVEELTFIIQKQLFTFVQVLKHVDRKAVTFTHNA